MITRGDESAAHGMACLQQPAKMVGVHQVARHLVLQSPVRALIGLVDRTYFSFHRTPLASVGLQFRAAHRLLVTEMLQEALPGLS